jgi:hypothetical protein
MSSVIWDKSYEERTENSLLVDVAKLPRFILQMQNLLFHEIMKTYWSFKKVILLLN